MTTSRLVALGDLHGHYTELLALYQQLLDDGFDPARDTLVQLGDCVDGGPDTKSVVQWCMEMAERHPHWVFLKGNHSDLMLDALRYNSRIYGSYDLWWGQGGKATAYSYLPQDASDYQRAIMQPTDYIPAAHLDWLEDRPLYHMTDRYIFVHAGLRPGIPLHEQTREDLLWIRESFFDSGYDFGRTVVFGHTAEREPILRYQPGRAFPDKIGVDTMTFDTGKLTAVELSGDAPRFYFQPASGDA